MISIGMLIILGLTFLVFLYKTEAPITEGRVILQQPYKGKLKLDIYLPTHEHDEPSPTILFIHGGAWITGSKRSINFNRFNEAINQLRAQGFTIISPQYTLASKDQSPFPNCIEDVYTVAGWISKNAEKYNLDLERFGVFGESAGAHLALILGYSQPMDFELEMEAPEVKYIVDVYGPTDLNALYHSATVDSLNKFLDKLPERLSRRVDLSQRLFGFDPEADSIRAIEFTRKYSPVAFLERAMPPTLIIHGESDKLVPLEQSQQLIDILHTLGSPYEYYTLPNVKHGFLGATKEQKELVQRWVYEFIIKHTQ